MKRMREKLGLVLQTSEQIQNNTDQNNIIINANNNQFVDETDGNKFEYSNKESNSKNDICSDLSSTKKQLEDFIH